MANSSYDFHKEEEKQTDLRFNRDTYIIVRIDGHKFHNFCPEHNFHKPNDKRGLDLMVESAKHVMRSYKGDISLAYGHSDEFSFLIRSKSDILSRRVYKITSMLPVIFATFYNSNFDKFFSNESLGPLTTRKYDAWFDARPKEYANYRSVIDYFRWRQIDCHINNLHNTTLSALTGRYIKYELEQSKNDGLNVLKKIPLKEVLGDEGRFYTPTEASMKLNGTSSAQKHDIMFKDYNINYNNELEQFKKGTIVVDSKKTHGGRDADLDSFNHYHVDLTKSTSFWDDNSHIFDDYVTCPPLRK